MKRTRSLAVATLIIAGLLAPACLFDPNGDESAETSEASLDVVASTSSALTIDGVTRVVLTVKNGDGDVVRSIDLTQTASGARTWQAGMGMLKPGAYTFEAIAYDAAQTKLFEGIAPITITAKETSRLVINMQQVAGKPGALEKSTPVVDFVKVTPSTVAPGKTATLTAAAHQTGGSVTYTWSALTGGTLGAFTGETTDWTAPSDSGSTDYVLRVVASVNADDRAALQFTIPVKACATSAPNLCGTTCVDLQTDANNCGSCGRTCGAGTTCSAGGCASTTASNPAISVTTGGFHACALMKLGGVKCWGKNDLGQLGDGLSANRATPGDVSGLTTGITAVAAGNTSRHTCAITSSATVKCWGANGYGQLGDGTTTDRRTPVDVAELGDVSAVAVGGDHTCALTKSGTIKCWGWGQHGQLGNGQLTVAQTSPVDITASDSFTRIAAGANHACARTSAGTAKCWGSNTYGQLGNASTNMSPTPVSVLASAGVPLGGVSSLAGGILHTCAVVGTGVKCWGQGANGRLGNGSTTDQLLPVNVSNVSGASAVTAGASYACALVNAVGGNGGGVKCWGFNATSQLGDGSTIDRTMAVNVIGLSSATTISGGGNHACAATASGEVKCWGLNSSGELGDGTTTTRSIPTMAVASPDGIWEVRASGAPGSPGFSDFSPPGTTDFFSLGPGSPLRRYAISTNSWATLTSPPLASTSYVSMARLGQNLYSIQRGIVARFDATNNTWATLANGVVASDMSQTTHDDDNHVFAMTSDNTKRIIRYDVASSSVTYLPTSVVIAQYGNPYEPRLAWDAATKRLYLAPNFQSPQLYEYDPVTQTTAALPSHPENFTNDIFCSDRAGHLFAGGHHGYPVDNSRSMWRYDIATRAWRQLPDLPFPKGNVGSCTVADGWLYVTPGNGQLARLKL